MRVGLGGGPVDIRRKFLDFGDDGGLSGGFGLGLNPRAERRLRLLQIRRFTGHMVDVWQRFPNIGFSRCCGLEGCGREKINLTDLSKDVRRVLLNHWTESEINNRLEDPEYFLEQVVIPHLTYLRRSGTQTPLIRLKKDPLGHLLVLLKP